MFFLSDSNKKTRCVAMKINMAPRVGTKKGAPVKGCARVSAI
jgi:hypothetical protein